MISIKLAENLAKIVGKDDLSMKQSDGGQALLNILIKPENANEVAAIIRLANQEKIPVIPAGKVDGPVAFAAGSVVLSLQKMNRILEIDSDNLTATVEAGLITAQLHKAVEEKGLFYQPDPERMDCTTLGGNIAESAVGPRAFKHRVTRDCVLGLEVVTATGEIWQVGGKTIKNVSGYDLIRLFVGSRGTLGIITKAILRLMPRPERQQTCRASFKTVESAGKAVAVLSAGKDVPSAVVYIRNSGQPDYFPSSAETPWGLLVEVDGIEASIGPQTAALEKICRQYGSDTFEILDKAAAAKSWLAVRNAAGEWRKTAVVEEVVVPRDKLPELLAQIENIGQRHGLNTATLGLAGIGRVCAGFRGAAPGKQEDETVVRPAVEELLQSVEKLKGMTYLESVAATDKERYMQAIYGQGGMELMRRLKEAWDPNNILNPGVVQLEGDR